MFALMPRRAPLLPRVEIADDFESLFNRLLDFPIADGTDWPNRWGLTTEENEKEYLLRFELPGFEPTEVKVEVVGDRLNIEAEHRPPEEKSEDRTERSFTRVRRTMVLPDKTNSEAVEAIYRNGILEVHVPRVPEASGRRIEVKS